MADAIGKVKGVVEVKNGIVLAGDALDIEVDRVKAALEGVDPDAVTKLLTDALTGNVTTQIQKRPEARSACASGCRKTVAQRPIQICATCRSRPPTGTSSR